MRLQAKFIIGSSFLSSASAFVPSVPIYSPISSSSLHAKECRCIDDEAELTGEPKPQVLKGVDLPSPADTPKDILWPFVDRRVGNFQAQAVQGTIRGMLGLEKDSPLSSTQAAKDALIKTQKLDAHAQFPNADGKYKFFGTDEHAKNLVYLLKTNPFFASALIECSNGFELRAFTKKNDTSFFLRIINCLEGGAGHRVNIRFDKHMCIKRVKVYDDINGEVVTNIKSHEMCLRKEEVDKWASSAIFNLIFYSSCVHANIHVLHYILTAALDFSSRDFNALNQWAKFYATNIPAKYLQVGQLLIRDQPKIAELGGGGNAGTVADTYAILTGSQGFGANGGMLIPILEELLQTWVAHPDKFLASLSKIDKETMKEGGILAEFTKHSDLVGDYALAVRQALRSTDECLLETAEDRLEDYLNRCTGFKSNIHNLEDWINLMAVTGIVHGSTLSYTRALANTEVARWRDIKCKTWQSSDVNLVVKVLATTCGMDEHRHVMSSSTDIVGVHYDSKLQCVLDKFDNDAMQLKQDYMRAIMVDQTEFNEYGWILSDFCPDGFDGKQLTVTTYI